jgi:hypothetical protein
MFSIIIYVGWVQMQKSKYMQKKENDEVAFSG